MISRYGWRGLLVALALGGCGADERAPALDDAPGAPAAVAGGRIVFLGTSLTAGLGLDPDQAYPALIQRKLDAEGMRFEVVNAGVSGETSAGARRRVEWLLRLPVAMLVIETGANDGLRGLEVDSLRANIQAIIDQAGKQTPKPRIVLVGMRAPPNLGCELFPASLDGYTPSWPRRTTSAAGPLSPRGRRGKTLAQPGGHDPSDRRRPAPHGRDGVGGARAGAQTRLLEPSIASGLPSAGAPSSSASAATALSISSAVL